VTTPEHAAVPLKPEWIRAGRFEAKELMAYCKDNLESRFPDTDWELEELQPKDHLAWFRLKA
jgi:hypothetical protein